MDGKVLSLFFILIVLLPLASSAYVLFDQSLTSHDTTISSEYVPSLDFDTRTADDFELDPGVWELNNVYFWIGWWGSDMLVPPDDFNIYIYEDDAGHPANPVTGGEWWSYTATSWTENLAETPHLCTFDIDVDPVTLQGETLYWIIPQPTHDFKYRDRVYQMGCACAVDVLWGEPVWFGSDYFGYSDWVDGSTVFGYDASSHFILNGDSLGIKSASFGEIKALFR